MPASSLIRMPRLSAIAVTNNRYTERSPMRARITTMLNLQDSMNRKVHADWIAQRFAWYRAAWIECGELIEHHGYKWWKK